MSGLESIPVKVEQATGNLKPLLHEVRHALERLLQTGEATSIDLKSLPIAPAELEALETALGRGEVSAELDVFGRSHIHETATPGVWLVEHFNSEGALMAKHVEVTRVPDILRSQPSDIAAGLDALRQQLA